MNNLENSSKEELLQVIRKLTDENNQLRTTLSTTIKNSTPGDIRVEVNPDRLNPVSYFHNFIYNAFFPIAAGLFRLVYKLIYRSK